MGATPLSTVKPRLARPTVTAASTPAAVPLDLTDFKRDLSELTDRLGHAQDCL
jgi:peptide chain release factor 2